MPSCPTTCASTPSNSTLHPSLHLHRVSTAPMAPLRALRAPIYRSPLHCRHRHSTVHCRSTRRLPWPTPARCWSARVRRWKLIAYASSTSSASGTPLCAHAMVSTPGLDPYSTPTRPVLAANLMPTLLWPCYGEGSVGVPLHPCCLPLACLCPTRVYLLRVLCYVCFAVLIPCYPYPPVLIPSARFTGRRLGRQRGDEQSAQACGPRGERCGPQRPLCTARSG